MSPLLLLLACVTTTRGAAKSDTPITCEAGVCTAGTRTSVSCYFNEDISVSRRAFSVAVYPFSASSDITVLTVLACKWTESRTKPECLVENRFSFNYRVTDHLTLEIPDATEEIAGKYACALVPSDHRTVQMCNLTVKVPGNETEKNYLRGQELKINQTGNCQGGYADFSRVNFVLNVLILVLFVVGIVPAVVRIKKRNRRLCGEKAADEKQKTPNGSRDGKQQTTESCHASVDVEPTTPLLNIHPQSISPTSSDSGNSSNETNGVSLA